MEISASHNICYETSMDMSVKTVTKSLLANERMIIESCGLLSAIYPNLVVQKKVVKIAALSHQSPLKEVFALSLFVAFQDELTEEVPSMIEKIFGIHVPENMDAVVTILVLMVAMQLITSAIERLFPGKGVAKLKAELEEKAAIAAKLTGASVEEINTAIEAYLSEGKRKSLLSKANDFFRPSKLSNDCAITTDQGFSVGPEAIGEIPSDLEIETQEDIRTYELDSVALEVHRTDRDYNKQGWRAVLKDVHDKPLRMELAPTLVPSDLYGAVEIVGNVVVVEERASDGDFVPKALHLLTVAKVKD